MTARTRPLATAVVAVAVLALAACGGESSGEDGGSSAAAPDRSSFKPITTQGLAAVVDEHLGSKVSEFYVFADEQDDVLEERYLGVRLRGADPRDSFVVTVYPPGGAGDQVPTGSCPDAGGGSDDPLASESCFPVKGGGNVTITTFSQGLAEDNTAGTYRMATSSGPAERQVTASYESYTKQPPISDKELSALLGDPDLGWKTSPKTNRAGADLKIAQEE